LGPLVIVRFLALVVTGTTSYRRIGSIVGPVVVEQFVVKSIPDADLLGMEVRLVVGSPGSSAQVEWESGRQLLDLLSAAEWLPVGVNGLVDTPRNQFTVRFDNGNLADNSVYIDMMFRRVLAPEELAGPRGEGVAAVVRG
jgi:hypothetical protein